MTARMPQNEAPRHARTAPGRRGARSHAAPSTTPDAQAGHTVRPAASNGVRRPLNATTAAHRAARTATDSERTRYRQAAAGVSRERAAQLGARPRRSHAPAIIGAVIGIALACLLVWWIGSAALAVFMDDGTGETVTATDAGTGTEAPAEDTARAVDATGTLDVGDFTYSLVDAGDGTYTLSRQNIGSDAAPNPRFTVTGTPVGMAVYNHYLYVVSNRDGRFYIQSYLPGDGSTPYDLREGEGTVTAVSLSDSALELAEEGGRTYTLDLAS